jgi:DNA-binding response OmpR family regulator
MSMKKILIVEDEASLVKALFDVIKKEGYEVETAENGQTGLVLALKSHPDLILLDIIMPVMDGMTMLRKLRQDAWGKDAKVILLTNLSGVEKMTESSAEGVHDYLIKSDWSLDDIIKKIKTKLE